MALIQVLPCTLLDVDAMVSVYLRAFSSNKLNHILFPSDIYYGSLVRNFFRARFEKALTQGHDEIHLFKVVEPEMGRLVSWARVEFPFELSEEERIRREETKMKDAEEREKAWPEGANWEVWEAFLEAMEAMREKHVKVGRDYVIHLLVTDPDFQGRGFGGRILREIMVLADADVRRIYLESTSAGHPLYEKLGWKDVDVLSVDMRKWKDDLVYSNSVMVREPWPME